MTCGERIRAARIARGYTVEELGRRSGLGAGTIARLEGGEMLRSRGGRIGADRLHILAWSLSVTPRWLLGDSWSPVSTRARRPTAYRIPEFFGHVYGEEG